MINTLSDKGTSPSPTGATTFSIRMKWIKQPTRESGRGESNTLLEQRGNLIQHFIVLKAKDKRQSISGPGGMKPSLILCAMPGNRRLCPNGSDAALCSEPIPHYMWAGPNTPPVHTSEETGIVLPVSVNTALIPTKQRTPHNMYCWTLVKKKPGWVETYGSCTGLFSACCYRHPSVLLLLDPSFLLWAGRLCRKENNVLLDAISEGNPVYHHRGLQWVSVTTTCKLKQRWDAQDPVTVTLMPKELYVCWQPLVILGGEKATISVFERKRWGTHWKGSQLVASLNSGQDCSGHKAFLTKMELHH